MNFTIRQVEPIVVLQNKQLMSVSDKLAKNYLNYISNEYGDGLILIAEIGNDAAGWATAYHHSEGMPVNLYMLSVIVNPDYRRNGIGKGLIDKLLECLPEGKFSYTANHNESAKYFFQLYKDNARMNQRD